MQPQRKRKLISARVGSWVPELEALPAYSGTASQPTLLMGDLVRHATLTHLNQGRPLQVLDTNCTDALCHYTEGPQQTSVLTWYPTNQLILIHAARDSHTTAAQP